MLGGGGGGGGGKIARRCFPDEYIIFKSGYYHIVRNFSFYLRHDLLFILLKGIGTQNTNKSIWKLQILMQTAKKSDS